MSPHGCDSSDSVWLCAVCRFNPLAPRESETILALYFLLSYVNFNPRFPWGKRGEQPGWGLVRGGMQGR